MVKVVEHRIGMLDGKKVDEIHIKFQNGKAIKVLFDENQELVRG